VTSSATTAKPTSGPISSAGGSAQHRACGRVGEAEATERVEDEDTVAAALDDALEARLARHQSTLQVDDLVAQVDCRKHARSAELRSDRWSTGLLYTLLMRVPHPGT